MNANNLANKSFSIFTIEKLFFIADLTTAEPINPAPPVIKIFISLLHTKRDYQIFLKEHAFASFSLIVILNLRSHSIPISVSSQNIEPSDFGV